ncbi:MAG: anthranilate phosphoribosyltransferase [Parvularcula sp.]|nr:anthranilate phosphoribosyltransferase [Parvularcula sp.]
MSFPALLKKVAAAETLSHDEMQQALAGILDGQASQEGTAAFLTALRVRGETIDEVAAAVGLLKQRALSIKAPLGTVDTCGTGGDGADSFNISTAVAFVLAGGGVPVAKHGNRAVSSQSGSSDVLTELGVDIRLPLTEVERGLAENGIAFLFAPNHHPALAKVAPVRKALGFRTLFNMLGPLLNPAGAKRQLIGVFSPDLMRLMAEVAQRMGSTDLWMVHGAGGLDELSLEGENRVCQLKDGKLTEFIVTASDAGLEALPNDALRGGDAKTNAAALEALLAGEKSAYREVVLFNAAAGFIVAGKAPDLKTGVRLAVRSLDEGLAQSKLKALRERGRTS